MFINFYFSYRESMHIEDTLNVYLHFIQEQEKNHSKKSLFKLSITEKLNLEYWNRRLTGQKQSKTHTHTQTNEKTGHCIEANPIL